MHCEKIRFEVGFFSFDAIRYDLLLWQKTEMATSWQRCVPSAQYWSIEAGTLPLGNAMSRIYINGLVRGPTLLNTHPDTMSDIWFQRTCQVVLPHLHHHHHHSNPKSIWIWNADLWPYLVCLLYANPGGIIGHMHNEILRVVPPECHRPLGLLFLLSSSSSSSPHRLPNRSRSECLGFITIVLIMDLVCVCVCLIIACSQGIQLPARVGMKLIFKTLTDCFECPDLKGFE